MSVIENAVQEIQRAQEPEGRVTSAIERRTSRVPSGVFLALALGSMAASAAIMGRELGTVRGRIRTGGGPLSLFIGQWAPALLLMGIYNKLVKLGR